MLINIFEHIFEQASSVWDCVSIISKYRGIQTFFNNEQIEILMNIKSKDIKNSPSSVIVR